MKRLFLLIILPVFFLCLFAQFVSSQNLGPLAAEDVIKRKIYAYRGWQSTGVILQEGESFTLKAGGKWLYSPVVGYHGPEGSRHYRAPDFYPMPYLPGGCLIGRIGELGEPFYVGRSIRWTAQSPGPLYLRINDDILSDNNGFITFSVKITGREGMTEKKTIDYEGR